MCVQLVTPWCSIWRSLFFSGMPPATLKPPIVPSLRITRSQGIVAHRPPRCLHAFQLAPRLITSLLATPLLPTICCNYCLQRPLPQHFSKKLEKSPKSSKLPSTSGQNPHIDIPPVSGHTIRTLVLSAPEGTQYEIRLTTYRQ